jgi:hypothetical protein
VTARILILALLSPGCATWTAVHHEKDLTEEDLAGDDLGHVLFSHTDLHGVRLQGATLARARFEHCNLQGADLSGADLTGADFRFSDLTGATLVGARTGEGTRFADSILTDARLAGVGAFACLRCTCPDGAAIESASDGCAANRADPAAEPPPPPPRVEDVPPPPPPPEEPPPDGPQLEDYMEDGFPPAEGGATEED